MTKMSRSLRDVLETQVVLQELEVKWFCWCLVGVRQGEGELGRCSIVEAVHAGRIKTSWLDRWQKYVDDRNRTCWKNWKHVEVRVCNSIYVYYLTTIINCIKYELSKYYYFFITLHCISLLLFSGGWSGSEGKDP